MGMSNHQPTNHQPMMSPTESSNSLDWSIWFEGKSSPSITIIRDSDTSAFRKSCFFQPSSCFFYEMRFQNVEPLSCFLGGCIWAFPKIGGKPPKWMVKNNGSLKPYEQMDDLGGKIPYFWKHPYTLGIQFPCQRMIGVYNHFLRKVFRFHYHSQKVTGSLGIAAVASKNTKKHTHFPPVQTHQGGAEKASISSWGASDKNQPTPPGPRTFPPQK